MRAVPRHTLAFLGVSAEEERLYRSVLSQSGRPIEDVAQGVESTPDDLRVGLARLVDLGMISFAEGRVAARAPTDAITDLVISEMRLITEAAQRLDSVREALPEVRRAFRPAPSAANHPLDGEVKIGGDIPGMLIDWIRTTNGEICWMRPDQWMMPHESDLAKAVAAAIATGRTCRSIYPVRALEQAPDMIRARARAGELVRIVPEVPARLALFGHTMALMQESFGLNSSRRLVVREPGLLDAVQALFDLYWERAIDVPGLQNPQAERRRVMQQLLLQQLADGAKDERIARTLGLSLRTVRRRVSELLDEFHVETRFQAGVEAVRRGLL